MRQAGGGIFAPIDVSAAALAKARDSVREQFPDFVFQGLCARYEQALDALKSNQPKLFVFLGSTIGNFTRSEFGAFFDRLSHAMKEGDFFLLGVDRVKDVEILEKAYDDSQGVTADFILNAFSHINRIAGTDFDRASLRYESQYNRRRQEIEMYAWTERDQEITFPSLGRSFLWERKEPILVEISRKFEPLRLIDQLQCFGLDPVEHFTDLKEWFSLLLFRRNPKPL